MLTQDYAKQHNYGNNLGSILDLVTHHPILNEYQGNRKISIFDNNKLRKNVRKNYRDKIETHR